MRSSGRNKIGIFCVIFIVVGVLLLWTGIGMARIGSKTPIDLVNEKSWDDLEKNMHIKTTFNVVFDVVWSETTTNTTYGIKTSEKESGRGYVLPLIIPDGNDVYIDKFIAYQTSDYTTPEKMILESNDWWDAYCEGPALPEDYCKTTLFLEGKLRKMTDEEYNLVYSYLESLGIEKEYIDSYICPFVIVKQNFGSAVIFIITGIGFLLVGAMTIFLPIHIAKKNANAVNASKASFVANNNDYDMFGQFQQNQTEDPYSQMNDTYDPYGSSDSNNNSGF